MSEYAELTRRLNRERETEAHIRAMNAHEIVDLVHGLEDRIGKLRDALCKVREKHESMYGGEDYEYKEVADFANKTANESLLEDDQSWC